LSKDKTSKEVKDLEEKSAQMAFGKATILLGNKDYSAAILNITSSLFSEYLRKNPKYESRFLRKQAEAYAGVDKYTEAKKTLLRARELQNEDSDFEDYFILGFIEYKLGNKESAQDNFRKFLKSASIFLESSTNIEKNKEISNGIEMTNKLINKLA
jgi:tetratricopeptide (TPR) repeat protein